MARITFYPVCYSEVKGVLVKQLQKVLTVQHGVEVLQAFLKSHQIYSVTASKCDRAKGKLKHVQPSFALPCRSAASLAAFLSPDETQQLSS